MPHSFGTDAAILLDSGFERHGAEETTDEDYHIHPDDVAKGAHDGKTVIYQCRETITHNGQQHQHVRVGGQGAERTELVLGGDVLVVIFLRGLDADELDIEDGEEDGNERF